jgi:hypothetical protein
LNLSFGYVKENELEEVSHTLKQVLTLAGEKDIELVDINKSAIIETVSLMAMALRQYGLKGILGDPDYFRQLDDLG